MHSIKFILGIHAIIDKLDTVDVVNPDTSAAPKYYLTLPPGLVIDGILYKKLSSPQKVNVNIMFYFTTIVSYSNIDYGHN